MVGPVHKCCHLSFFEVIAAKIGSESCQTLLIFYNYVLLIVTFFSFKLVTFWMQKSWLDEKKWRCVRIDEDFSVRKYKESNRIDSIDVKSHRKKIPPVEFVDNVSFVATDYRGKTKKKKNGNSRVHTAGRVAWRAGASASVDSFKEKKKKKDRRTQCIYISLTLLAQIFEGVRICWAAETRGRRAAHRTDCISYKLRYSCICTGLYTYI